MQVNNRALKYKKGKAIHIKDSKNNSIKMSKTTKGLLIKKHQIGGSLVGDKQLTPEDWKKQNETLGYKPVPYLQTQGGSASKYPHYYDPKKYSINPDMTKSLDGKNPGWSIMDVIANKPIDMNRLADNQMFSFQKPVIKRSVITNQKPVVAVQTDRQRITTDNGFILRYKDGRPDEYYNQGGQPIKVLSNAKGGLMTGKKKIKKCSCGSLMYKKSK